LPPRTHFQRELDSKCLDGPTKDFRDVRERRCCGRPRQFARLGGPTSRSARCWFFYQVSARLAGATARLFEAYRPHQLRRAPTARSESHCELDTRQAALRTPPARPGAPLRLAAME